MNNPGDNKTTGDDHKGLLSLAFACNEMVNQLSNGLKLEFQGDHQSAMAELELVRDEIDSWLERLDELESRELDKDRIAGSLKEVRQAVNLEDGS